MGACSDLAQYTDYRNFLLGQDKWQDHIEIFAETVGLGGKTALIIQNFFMPQYQSIYIQKYFILYANTVLIDDHPVYVWIIFTTFVETFFVGVSWDGRNRNRAAR